MSEASFEPTIVGFLCNWCSYRAADLAGSSRIKYAANVRSIRVMCSGRVDPAFVMKAFAGGADAVIIAGCHPGECHYLEQNYKTIRRFTLLKHTLVHLGVEPDRIHLLWASASEGVQLAAAVDDIVDRVKKLGPMRWQDNWNDLMATDEAVRAIGEEHATAMEVRP